MNTVKTNVSGLVKDKNKGIILNTDMSKYNEMIKERERSNQIISIKNDVDDLKYQLKSVRSLLDEITVLVKR